MHKDYQGGRPALQLHPALLGYRVYHLHEERVQVLIPRPSSSLLFRRQIRTNQERSMPVEMMSTKILPTDYSLHDQKSPSTQYHQRRYKPQKYFLLPVPQEHLVAVESSILSVITLRKHWHPSIYHNPPAEHHMVVTYGDPQTCLL